MFRHYATLIAVFAFASYAADNELMPPPFAAIDASFAISFTPMPLMPPLSFSPALYDASWLSLSVFSAL
jgi:hypothetical protein